MSIIRGVSGAAVLDVRGPAFDFVRVVLHNAQYEVELENLIREATTPNGRGWTEGLPKLKTVRRVDIRWFDRFAQDEAIYPVLGYLQPGTELNIYLRRGERPRWYAITYSVIRRLDMKNTPKTARTWELVAEHGQFYSAPAPESLDHYLGYGSGGGGGGGGGEGGGQ